MEIFHPILQSILKQVNSLHMKYLTETPCQIFKSWTNEGEK